jgi:hypothetical protein
VTELPLNIEDLRRYSRQQRQEITSRLKNFGRESSDHAFERTARGLRTSVDDETALAWGPKVVAAKDMSLTPEEAEQRWRNSCGLKRSGARITMPQLLRNIRKKAEAALRQVQKRGCETRRVSQKPSPASARSCVVAGFSSAMTLCGRLLAVPAFATAAD